jgi:MtN3 and saliva related transmembrane protein
MISKDILLSISSFIAIVTTIISITPQAIKVYKTKSAKDICLITMLNLILCAISWIVYGILINDKTVWSPNLVLLISSAYIAYFKISNKN